MVFIFTLGEASEAFLLSRSHWELDCDDEMLTPVFCPFPNNVFVRLGSNGVVDDEE